MPNVHAILNALIRFFSHQRTKHALQSMLFGILGAAIWTGITQWLSPAPKIATVNVTAMIDTFVEQESKQKLPEKKLRERVKTFSQTLEKTIQTVGRKENLILFPSEAVIDGGIDVTAKVESQLPKEKTP